MLMYYIKKKIKNNFPSTGLWTRGLCLLSGDFDMPYDKHVIHLVRNAHPLHGAILMMMIWWPYNVYNNDDDGWPTVRHRTLSKTPAAVTSVADEQRRRNSSDRVCFFLYKKKEIKWSRLNSSKINPGIVHLKPFCVHDLRNKSVHMYVELNRKTNDLRQNWL